MTIDELNRIERELDIKLPPEYCEGMLKYPFNHFNNEIYPCEFPNDPKIIIKNNNCLRKEGFFGAKWSNHFFNFGGANLRSPHKTKSNRGAVSLMLLKKM